jgi:hypothetical protein
VLLTRCASACRRRQGASTPAQSPLKVESSNINVSSLDSTKAGAVRQTNADVGTTLSCPCRAFRNQPAATVVPQPSYYNVSLDTLDTSRATWAFRFVRKGVPHDLVVVTTSSNDVSHNPGVGRETVVVDEEALHCSGPNTLDQEGSKQIKVCHVRPLVHWIGRFWSAPICALGAGWDSDSDWCCQWTSAVNVA